MLKSCLCILLLGLCGASGWLKSREFHNRRDHVRDLIMSLKILQSEMSFRKDPLPELLLCGKEFGHGLAADFFHGVGMTMKVSSGCSLEIVWQQQADQVYEGTSVTLEDLRILKDFAKELGQTDLGNQETIFQRTLFLLEKQEQDAEAAIQTKGKMYRALGLSVGALLVIGLI
ncbi:MAG: stage III sporulation protein AB [Firmicutes bacterium]|nr:stage III sporulation protein AB [Bacillota bacterium]